jgi:hypothetical protein
VIAGAIDVIERPYASGDVVSKTAEVDDMTASAQRGRTLDECRPEFRLLSSVGPAIPVPEIRTVLFVMANTRESQRLN